MNKCAHTWSKAELMEMFQLRMEGYSLQEIGDKFGITRERVRQILNKPVRVERASTVKFVYPAISDYLKCNRINLCELASRTGTAYSTMYNTLTGRTDPRKRVIDKILSETGLTYEEAFRTNSGEGDVSV